ncbi:uncharacterized protein F4822DRAFT_163622 [Hypoxylon trugodes]|uniref:uncharacterized protein n=1 Tax=Hypoxylon trugodes TaxID=326681 RepID=UPI002194A3BB|nr:uncharacterized protein F4822DRAFT_163622 [Hypoxylon trugodes]KAI1390804.1 hypothetical protein F4822DRAFT_163622 [Hypoxylon trugodes]
MSHIDFDVSKATEVDGMGIFFGCGHRFILAVEETPALSRECADSFKCPLRHSHMCLSWNDSFPSWLDSCGSCDRFCTFDAMADKVAAQDVFAITFKHGIVSVPCIGNEKTLTLLPRVFGFGFGRVEFRAIIDEAGVKHVVELMFLYLWGMTWLNSQGCLKNNHLVKIMIRSEVNPWMRHV